MTTSHHSQDQLQNQLYIQAIARGATTNSEVVVREVAEVESEGEVEQKLQLNRRETAKNPVNRLKR